MIFINRSLVKTNNSSAASERSFSTSGRVIEERRTRLKGDTVDSLLFLNVFFKKKM